MLMVVVASNKINPRIYIILRLQELKMESVPSRTWLGLDLHEPRSQYLVLGALFLAWNFLNFIVQISFNSKKLKRKELVDTRNRIISMVHGIASFIMACFIFPTHHFNEPNTAFINFVCLFSLAYFAYDLLACLYYDIWDMGLIIHHVLCLAGFGSAIWFNYGGIDSIGGLFVAEVSNLPMHTRIILKQFGLRYTKSYELCENFYLASYIVSRGIICPIFILSPSLMSPNSPIMVKIICFSITVQSYYYILKMTKIIRKKVEQFKEMKRQNISYRWLEESEEVKKLSFYRSSDGPKIF